MVRFIVMIFVALFVNLLTPASAVAQEMSRFQCQGEVDCGFLEICSEGRCKAKPCTNHEECPGGMCTSGGCVFIPCGAINRCLEPAVAPKPKIDFEKIQRERDERTRKIAREEIQKIPLPTPPAPVKGDKGDNGTSVKVTQAANGAIVEDGQGNTAIIKDGKNGDDRPLNAEVGMVTGLRQTGGTPVFNLGADLKLIFKDLWYLKFAWQFGTALIDHDDRQFQSVVQAALGLRLDAFSPNLGLDLGIGAEYSQTGTLPFSGWDRRSWTAKVESDLYPLVWAGVADEWKRFFKIGVNLGLGEEFKPGSTASNLLFDATVYLGINAVF